MYNNKIFIGRVQARPHELPRRTSQWSITPEKKIGRLLREPPSKEGPQKRTRVETEKEDGRRRKLRKRDRNSPGIRESVEADM